MLVDVREGARGERRAERAVVQAALYEARGLEAYGLQAGPDAGVRDAALGEGDEEPVAVGGLPYGEGGAGQGPVGRGSGGRAGLGVRHTGREGPGDVLDGGVRQRGDQRLAVGEVPVHGAAHDSGGARDVVHGRVRVAHQLGERDVHDAAAVGGGAAAECGHGRTGSSVGVLVPVRRGAVPVRRGARVWPPILRGVPQAAPGVPTPPFCTRVCIRVNCALLCNCTVLCNINYPGPGPAT